MTTAIRLGVAALSGWIAYLSYEPIGWWPAGIVAMALLWWSLWWRRPHLGIGALTGFVHGLVMYLFALPWIGELVGNMPYVALAIACAIYALLTSLGGAALARWNLGFLAFPFVYVAVEHLRSSFPFGGFAWVRLSWGQIDGPLAYLSTLGGPVLVTLAAVFAGVGLVALFTRYKIIGALAIFIPLLAGVIAYAIPAQEPTGEVKVAAIQGNVPRLGLDFNAQRRAVLANHVRVTEELAQSEDDIDLVFWPENSSDVNPFTDSDAAAAINGAVEAIDAPVLVGTITQDEVGARNTMQVFDPEDGAGDYHHKKYLQPFGEYMPYRDFFRMFSEYVDLAGDFKPGDGNGVVRMRDVAIGVATCFEVIVDAAYRTSISEGAQILTTPTNNATFGFSDMTYQQLAMSRMRAIELDRAVVVAATSGVSAIVHPDGSVTQTSEIFEPAALVETLPLKTSVTPAVTIGAWLEWAFTIIGIILGLAAVFAAFRHRSTGKKN